MSLETAEKVTADHLRRDAYLYVRQSTLRQVMENTTSTQRQYGLRQRATALGWPAGQVVVIDEDLGRSGATAEGRDGFQRLVADVGMGKAGIVIGLEVSLFGEEAWSRQMLIGELGQQPASRYYRVAEEAGTLVGYAGLLAAGAQADVLTIAVSTARWGQGIGSQLLADLLEEAARRGCTEIFLEVRADNTRAQRLYRWWGFDEIGIRRGYYQPSGMDAIVMRRNLAGVLRPGPAGESANGGSPPRQESTGGTAARRPGEST